MEEKSDFVLEKFKAGEAYSQLLLDFCPSSPLLYVCEFFVFLLILKNM